MAVKKIGLIVGSVRKASFSKMVSDALISLAPAGYELGAVDLAALPMYNQDLDDEGNTPAAWTAFRGTIRQLDGIIFITPEYNRSVPPVLKNAVDIGSRPYGASVWNGKPGAVISVSPGAIGGFGANHHLRQSLVFLNVPLLQQPEAYIGSVHTLFDETGRLAGADTKKFLTEFLDAYAAWVEKLS